MAGHVDDVVDATHDVDVTVLVLEAGVAGEVMAGMLGQVRLAVCLVVVPQRRQATRRQRQFQRDGPDLAGGHVRVLLAQHAHVVAGHRLGRRARLHRQHAEADAIGGDGPRGLGLPPVIDDRHPQTLARPEERVGIAALAGQEQRPETRQIVLAHVRALRIFLLHGAKGGGRGEEGNGAVLADHAPERAGVRGADRLALVEDRGAALQQRPVDDVGVAHRPADVGGGPPHLAGANPVDVLHRPFERHRVAAVVVHDALGDAGGARRIEDIERVGGGDRHALGGRGTGHEVAPVEVAALDERRSFLRPLEDHAPLGLVAGQLDGAVEQRLVRHDAIGLEAA